MKKKKNQMRIGAAAFALLAAAGPVLSLPGGVAAADGAYTAEYLDRGVCAVNTGAGMMVSWRFLASDSDSAVFKLYRDGALIYTSEEGKATSFLDQEGTAQSLYRVDTEEGGKTVSSSVCSMISDQSYFDIALDVPAAGADYTYSPCDCSVGDVDGDGVYEIFLKWDPSNSKDNSQAGATGNVYIDCLRLTGERLWRVDLGQNIRAGAHYTQFLVADFDLDGKAEMTCKTADGTVDGVGNVIGDGSKTYRNSSGYILEGPEYYSLFDGLTGAVLDTVDYEYPRGEVSKSTWGDNYGNRCDRFLGAVCYLDGVKPSAVSVRGYYTRMTVVAYDVVDKKLVKRWGYDSGFAASSYTGYANGNHNCMPADLDGDGKDELCVGAVCFDDDGSILWCTNRGHGDAMHLSDFLPDRPGEELWVCHEHEPYGVSLVDAGTGEIIFHYDHSKDTGRCAAGNISAANPGGEFWGAQSGDVYDGAGQPTGIARGAMNFLIWWDGDLERELLDGNTISKINVENPAQIDTLLTADGCLSCNGTKSTPCLSGDILGDWREELILRTEDNGLRIFCTPYETEYRLTTLTHDPQYRCQLAGEQNCYNQPPHPSFYLGSDKPLPARPNVTVHEATGGENVPAVMDPAKYYVFRNLNSGLYLTADADGNAAQRETFAAYKGVWRFEEAGENAYQIFLANDSESALTVAGNGNAELGAGQSFTLYRNAQGYVITTDSSGGANCVEIENAGTDDGANAREWERNGHPCQIWGIEAVSYIPGERAFAVGDCDENGTLSAKDLSLLKRVLTANAAPSRIETRAMDLNADTQKSAADAVLLSRLLLGETPEGLGVSQAATDSAIYKGIEENTNAGALTEAYVNLENTEGSFVEFEVFLPFEAETVRCVARYANGTAAARTVTITANGESAFPLSADGESPAPPASFETTGDWTTWAEQEMTLVNLHAGLNTVRIASAGADGAPNLDTLAFFAEP